jgi:sugar/nucleoside kinase (ribokinase family)
VTRAICRNRSATGKLSPIWPNRVCYSLGQTPRALSSGIESRLPFSILGDSRLDNLVRISFTPNGANDTQMTADNTCDIMMIGHFAKDHIVVDGVRAEACGGGVYYGGIALRRLGLRVAVVTRLHPDDFPLLNEMKAEGIRLHAIPAAQTSGIENTYDSADMERRRCRPLGFAGPFMAEDIPDWPARIYLANPIIAGELDLNLVDVLAQRGPLALDIQGFVRVREGDDLVFRDWPEVADGLARVTYLKVDLAEAELLTGAADPLAAARRLADFGPREIILTQSSGLIVLADGQVIHAPFQPRSLAGRTGRGDTCFATYLGMRLSAAPDKAAKMAAAITTLKQEQPGPWRGSRAETEALISS